MLEFRVLGTLELAGSCGAPLAPAHAQPKRVALLTYLALARSRGGHTRDHLLALLWPERDDSHARAALRQAIHHLRHALGEQAIVASGFGELSPRVRRVESATDGHRIFFTVASDEADIWLMALKH